MAEHAGKQKKNSAETARRRDDHAKFQPTRSFRTRPVGGLGRAIIQAKLAVGPANDSYEREADAVAARVVRSLRVQRSPTDREATAERVPTRIQRSTAPGAIGLAGGELDSSLDQKIQSFRGGGSEIPAGARDSMESAFGADFSAIRVHHGAQAADLSDRIQAKAFTTGNDIFFRDGLPDTSSAEGQHLLAHELTHTIQQGAATVHRFAERAPAANVQRAPRAVQRLYAGKIAHKWIGAYPRSGDKVVDGATWLAAGSEVTVDDDPTAMSYAVGDPDSDGDPKLWARIQQATDEDGNPVTDLWLKLSDIKSKAADPFDSRAEVAGAALSVNAFTGTVGGTKTGDDRFVKDGDYMVTGQTGKNLGYAADAGGIAGMFLSLAKSVKKFKADDSNSWDKTEAVIDGVAAAGAGAKSVASIAKRATDKAGKTSEAVGGLAMFGSIFSGIKSTFTIVKKAVELSKEADTKSNDEKFHDSMEIVSNLLNMAANGVSAAKSFLDTFSTGANAALGASVPGFGIALGAADLVVRSVDLVTGLVHKSRMRTDKRGHKEGLLVPAFGNVVAKEVGKTGKKLKAATTYKKLCKARDNGKVKDGSDEDKFLAWADGDDAFQSYLFSKGLQYINQKRANRALLKIAKAMTAVAGDVATLGGASAPVGVGLKAGALALDVGSSMFRKFKQHFRDKRAKKEAAGEEISGALLAFDSKKSSGRKLQEYNKMVDRIFDMIVDAVDLPKPVAPAKDTRFDSINKYFAAVGISMGKIKKYVADDDPAGLRTEMIKYLKKRE